MFKTTIYSVILNKKLRMTLREENVIQIRPTIANAKVYENMNAEEYFQNSTLRPILKLQNPMFIILFQNYITKHKNKFYTLNLEKRFDYIENAVQKDIKFRNTLKGVIVGIFTINEYNSYLKNSSALNKRMMKMVVERLKDQIQIFEKETLVD